MASAAARQLVRTTVVLVCLGEHVRDVQGSRRQRAKPTDRCLQGPRELLYDLCLVSKKFNFVFTRSLYRDIELDSIDTMRSLCRTTRSLGRVKSLSVNSFEQAGDHAEVVMLVRKILPSLPRLESLKWYRLLPAENAVWAPQQSQNRLKHLRIDFPIAYSLFQQDWFGHVHATDPALLGEISKESGWLYRPPDMAGIHNLQSLTLHNIGGGLGPWRECLVQVLIRSPRLHTLALSLDFSHFEGDTRDFFNLIGDEYAAAGGAPLPLRTLRCGRLVLPTREDSLRKLVGLSRLEVVHLDNYSVLGKQHRWTESWGFDKLVLYGDTAGIAFPVFFGDCPNLRRFSVSELHRDVFEALRRADTSHLGQDQVQVAVAVPFLKNIEDFRRHARGISDAFVLPAALELCKLHPSLSSRVTGRRKRGSKSFIRRNK